MKKIILATLGVSALFSQNGIANVPGRADYVKAKEIFRKKMSFAFYDIEKIFPNMPEYEKITKELMEFEERMKVESESSIKDLQGRVEKLNIKDASKMSESDKAAVKSIYDEAEKLQEDLKRRKTSKQKALVEPLMDKIKAAVRGVRKKLEVDVVFNKMVIEDCDDLCDITNFVFSELGVDPSDVANKSPKNLPNVKTIKK